MNSDLSISLLSRNPSDQSSNNNNTLPSAPGTTNMTSSGINNPTSGTTIPSAQEQEANQEAAAGGASKLNTLNYINVASYLLNFIVTYGVGTLGWIGNGNNAVLSEKYQTLVTPKATAFSIWAIIFVAQAIFAVIQCLPKFRSSDLVQKGVGHFYAWTSLFQVLWTIAFAYEVIWLSVIFMVLIWICLIEIAYSQHFIVIENKQQEQQTPQNGTWPPTRNVLEFWSLQFPFAIHCGWITAASLLNVNVVFVSRNAAAYIQLAVGIVSLAILHAISVWVVFGIRRNPNYTIAFVLAWANFWIHKELQSPKDVIVDRFGGEDGIVVPGVSLAALAVACAILLQIIYRRIVLPSGFGDASVEDCIDNLGAAADETPDTESDDFEPPQYAGKFVKEQSPGFNSISTAVTDSSIV